MQRWTERAARIVGRLGSLYWVFGITVGALLLSGLVTRERKSSGENPQIGPAAAGIASEWAGRPRVLEFLSPHCPACARAAPMVKSVAKRCAADDGTIVAVDVENPQGAALAERFGIRSVPSFVSIDSQGREKDRVVGVPAPGQLALVLEGVAGKTCSAL